MTSMGWEPLKSKMVSSNDWTSNNLTLGSRPHDINWSVGLAIFSNSTDCQPN